LFRRAFRPLHVLESPLLDYWTGKDFQAGRVNGVAIVFCSAFLWAKPLLAAFYPKKVTNDLAERRCVTSERCGIGRRHRPRRFNPLPRCLASAPVIPSVRKSV
jgi:hypothetical protein